ncbi:MAG: putative phosphatidylcholine-sterol O-acyltransferase [Streblomastix strix]|uniref:Putative phosphatidylcholine-sterol O-acyltransferase n=1 Tax=Streblomastix strix TaxID=222440 RepID=A0A5J4UM52_9EUKA|nr:MAG: putative phosphatidylcholine-sterol O-acyltransferase [Streblomastix strix]
MHNIFKLAIFAVKIVTCTANTEKETNLFIKSDIPPLVIVPGIGQSRLEYRYKSEGDSSAYRQLWLVMDNMIANKSLYTDDMKIQFDPVTDEYKSADHVDIRPYDFGGVEGFSILDPKYPQTDKFIKLVKNLESVGYIVGKSLFGALYDYRLSGPTNVKKFGFFADLQNLIEKAYNINGRKAVLLGHSLGTLISHHFLSSYVTAEWKKKYLECYVSVNGVYGGTVESFSYTAAYRKWIVPGITLEESYDAVKYISPLYWNLPNKYGYDEENDVIAEIPSLNVTITSKNISWIYESTGRLDLLAAYNNVKHIRDELKAPGIKTYSFTCIGEDTLYKLVYNYTSPDKQQENKDQINDSDQWWKHEGYEVFGNGDNSANPKCLKVPLLWRELQEQPVIWKEYTGADHSGILKDDRFWLDLRKILVGDASDDEKEL